MNLSPGQNPQLGSGGSPAQSKRALRSLLAAQLKQITPSQRLEWSQKVCEGILASSWYRGAASLFVFLSDPQEPDLGEVVRACLGSGRTVCAPRMDWATSVMQACEVLDPARDVVASRYGLTEPAAHCRVVAPGTIDLVLIPGIAFDRSGNRLGRGGGFYDRFLAQSELRARRLGVAFDLQIVPDVPSERHDARMDAVVTPSGFIEAGPHRDPHAG